MHRTELFSLESPYRERMAVEGFRFGKGDKAACILGPVRGSEVQQLYICSRLVKALKEIEANGNISSTKEIMVVPCVNPYSMNVGKRFWPMDNVDINRMFPGSESGDTTARIADGVMRRIKEYSYGIQFTSFYMPGEFAPHVRMMETGYQNTSLANLFGLPYVVVRKPMPIDTKTLNYNWQNENTAAFSVYTNETSRIDESSAKQAVAAVLRFLTRMGLIRYESHSGYISHVIMEEDLTPVHAMTGGISRQHVRVGDEVRYGDVLGEILDPYEGSVKAQIIAPTDGIIFFENREALMKEGDMIYQLIHRLHA